MGHGRQGYRKHKNRDRSKVERKKYLHRERKLARRAAGVRGVSPETLVARAFDPKLPVARTNPFAGVARLCQVGPKKSAKSVEAMLLRAAELGLAGPEWVATLEALAFWRRRWVRAPEAVEVSGDSDWARMRSFVGGLLAKYPVAECFFEPFLRSPETGGDPARGDRYQSWLVDLGRGKNLRQCRELPFRITRAIAHLAGNTPPGLGLYAGLRRAQMVAAGVSLEVVDQLSHSALARPYPADVEVVWDQLVQLLRTARKEQVGDIRALIHMVRVERLGESGPVFTPVRVEPRQPTLELQGRSLRRWLGLARDWQQAWFRQQEEQRPRTWRRRHLGRIVPGGEMVELCSVDELASEGAALQHCIATYARYCQDEESAIVAFRASSGRRQDRLTLDVELRPLKVVEVHGLQNRDPTPAEQELIADWARRIGAQLDY